MAWETRKGRGTYYARSRKVNGRVVREYVGIGPAGEAAARVDALERIERAEARERIQAERDAMAELAHPLTTLARYADALTRGVLLAAGYRQHDRGQWRKRRDKDN